MNILARFINRLRFRLIPHKDESINVVDGMVKARQLYKRLAVIAHPDRHADKRDIAEELMSKITANRYNYYALIRLEQEVNDKLS